MYILGISGFYHDSAAAIVRDGRIVAAAQEERFTRKKHDAEFPIHAVNYCLKEAGITAEQLDFVGFYEKPLVKFERLLETYLAYVPVGFESFRRALPLWLGKKLYLTREIDKGLGLKRRHRYVFSSHHESHAASAFFPSPFEEAAIMTMDGVGEWSTATLGYGSGNRVEVQHEIRFPHSLGLLYSAITYYTGFEVNGGEYKVMGLAPYGEPRFKDLITEHLIDIKDDGSFWMDMSYFNYAQGLTMTSNLFHKLFGRMPRRPDEPVEQFHMDVAASVQKVTEEIMLRTAWHVHRLTGSRNLCMAGGVALNCVANGRILREGPFENVWIQPAAGDAGGALGVALLIWYQLLENPRPLLSPDGQDGSLLGPAYDSESIQTYLKGVGATYERLAPGQVADRVAQLMADGKVIGWFQGRMEYGPRALGSRSIIGDARNSSMQTMMNVKVKFRESFRPFAPCVLREHVDKYFEMRPREESPYMLLVAPVKAQRRLSLTAEQKQLAGIDLLNVPRSDIPAVTHVDYSARVQTVDNERNIRLYELMQRFNEKTGSPVIINTSFNLSWEPIVNQPEDAYNTFMSSDMDTLMIEDILLNKETQQANLEARRTGAAGVEIDPLLTEICLCPACDGALWMDNDRASCKDCQRVFEREGGIWKLFWPHEPFDGDVTQLVKSFYEETPFPNYDEDETVSSLIGKAGKGVYARLLGDQIPYNARVLEVGCGTGQLSNFLGVSCRSVVGTDMCMNSLRLAENFRQRNGLSRVRFIQMNLFKPALQTEQFDVVLCNGVLHHTGDPVGGFRSIVRLVKPGGHIVVALYNTFGRLLLDARRVLFNVTGNRFKHIDPYLRSTKMSKDKERAWFADQYKHPHESKHTFDEVLRWFKDEGFDFINAVPKFRWSPFSDQERLFEPDQPGSALERFLVQASMVVTGSKEGGFFTVIGRKRGDS